MSRPEPSRFVLRVLGAPDLRSPDGQRAASVLSQPKRLGLLTYLAMAPSPVSRSSLVATFWPESDEARARNALSQALFHLRRSLGDDVVQSLEGDRLWIPADRLCCDARALLLDDAAGIDLAEVQGRELLEGWNADDSQPLQDWLDAQRERVRERVARLAGRASVEAEMGAPPIPGPVESSIRTSAAGPRPGWLRPALVGAAFLAIALLGVVFADPRLGEEPPASIVVLLPRVTESAGAAAISAQAILDEVLAHLPDGVGLRVVPVPWVNTVPELRRQLATIGAPDESTMLILETSVRVTDDEVRVVGFLHRGETFDVPGRESFSVPFSDESVVVEIPSEIGDSMSAMVRRVMESAPAR